MMQKLIAQVRELGFDSDLLSELDTDLARIDQEVEAIRPAPPPHQARASLAELLLLTYELGPRALTAYGEIAEDNARYLEQQGSATDGAGPARIRPIRGTIRTGGDCSCRSRRSSSRSTVAPAARKHSKPRSS
jgi:hypothetical protein